MSQDIATFFPATKFFFKFLLTMGNYRRPQLFGAQVARAFPARPDGEVGTVIGSARSVPIDIAAFWNTAMIRYLDFNDLLDNKHPSDMIGGLVAMSRTAKVSGPDMLIAIVQARLKAVDRDGKTYEVYVRDPLGHYLNPLTVGDIDNKFKNLTVPALGRDRAVVAFDRAWRTQEAESFAAVLDAFVAEKGKNDLKNRRK